MGLSLLPVIVVLSVLLTSPSILPLADSVTDREALLSLKSLITSDPSNALHSWNNTMHVCGWSGVFCNRHNQRVTGLDLQGLSLAGSITPFIGNLSMLRVLRLQNNQLSGPLPDQIGNLFRLQELNVSSNLIDGSIPINISLCSKLAIFDLTSNQISGTIPPELQHLGQLQFLKLSHNRLSGSIPPSIGNLSSLTTLELSTNNISGPIPDTLGRLRNLKQLQISINNLTGTIPWSLYNLSSLSTFAMASNDLWGEIPGDIGFRLPNLLVFHVCYNKFTGLIPPSLHNLTKINSIRMSHDFFTGTVPPGLENLHELTMYNIGYNQIVNPGQTELEIITSLTNATNLVFLALDGNLFEGVIPESVGNLSSSLSKFYIGGNPIHGPIPASIGKLRSLSLLNMSNNLLSGDIPPEIGNLKELQILGLAGNRISGEIPAFLGNLTKLTDLELFDNYLEGIIPSEFGNYQYLVSLDLSNNRLSGPVPKEVFSLSTLSSLLNLSKNSLTGELPTEIGVLENVVLIDISNNLFSGGIPNSIGNCKSLQGLSMANNSLSGPIPDTISNLKGLQTLDLSSNKLSGSIPAGLQGLQALQLLNLSFNEFTGEVPKGGIFRNHSIAYLEGNPNLCMKLSCKNDRKTMKLRITILVVLVVAISTIATLFWVVLQKPKAKINARGGLESFKGKRRMVSYGELLRATDNFDAANLIGRGSFGSVYRGTLSDDDGTSRAVAVKVFDLGARGASKSFVAECEALRGARHRNLVRLITSCTSVDHGNSEFCALVYELAENGSLSDWIRGGRRPLSAIERLDIAIGIASGIEYLHHDCQPPVVHHDLKPSNVLLDGDMTVKIADFGLARLLINDLESMTNGLKGSIGYIPPEYGMGGKASTSGDVYSYGVILLELLTGKSPTDEMFKNGMNLNKWVGSAYPEHVMDIMDIQLLSMTTMEGGNYDKLSISGGRLKDCLVSLIGVGLACSGDVPEARISIREALQQLEGIREKLLKELA
ncbi:putative LRR receptor-like serine/threonine-protein kinase [Acorus calamus]|uniref:Receptor kinase-like protein Xa21 n=1 Tax=Acorus calamus TaxID=4465 RepID=A0AAV9DFM8_ACOCL|nr:putative LRR receptor-like serine/threonine-protein kinase [Acorus calamus]